ncbi:hypothetical protein [Sphingomonas mollis]|uniref:Uncharacterized protein n=1 Tax=Sphingomonas mollis TaxID=2795726 RepID=A0ABS0XST3_9SPHN|nr:hypothetical protein [Sphingomonas sp. BT553]MBJ6122820.1 hypothetical protein [Sphingomonas sp. BT553]
MSGVTMFSLIALYFDYRKQQAAAPVLTTAPAATPANDREPMRAEARAA